MNRPMSSTPIPWKHVRNILVLFAPLWLGAAVLFGMIGMGYSLFRKDTFVARQPLVVRDEATTSLERLGRFASQTELKAAQETILEMTKNPEVVGEALRTIGPPSGRRNGSWPTTKVIDAIASSQVNLVAPKGSEFGNTEVVYLTVEAESPGRANEFCEAIYSSLAKQLRLVRQVRADSIIAELSHARDLAQKSQNVVAARMREIEIELGADLGELRNLNDTISGDGTNRRTLEETTRELELAEQELRRSESLYNLLLAGAKDPTRLLISGSELLESQPSLERLKDGLIDAQLEASQLSGIFTKANPRVKAAIGTELEIRKRMRQETEAAIAAMQPSLKLQRDSVARLKARNASLVSRLSDLANIRADYSKLDSDFKHRSEVLADAQRALSTAVASRSAALSTNLIAELGPPQIGDDPVGPGGSVLTVASSMAGLIFGLGTVFLIAPGPTDSRGGRRWSDYLGSGRRSEDRSKKNQPVSGDDSTDSQNNRRSTT